MGGRLTLAGLGPGAPAAIPAATLDALRAATRIFLRTGRHPAVAALEASGLAYETFDSIYDRAGTFEEVYDQIATRVVEEASAGQVVYAVPGHPLVGESSVRRAIDLARSRGIEVLVAGGTSFLDPLFTILGLDPTRGLQIIDSTILGDAKPSPAMGLVISQVYSRRVASDVKLALMGQYPDEHPVTIVRAAGVPGEERVHSVPLFELDHGDNLDHLTTLYVPPLREPAQAPFDRFIEVVRRLRGEGGCPWDREQTHRSLRQYLIEEAYEVLEAIDDEEMNKLCEELGDLLLQVALHAVIAAQDGHFDIEDVLVRITDKMIRRHPHVFGTVQAADSQAVVRNWEQIKERERLEQGRRSRSLLDGVPSQLPALMHALRIQKRAARVGFDWGDPEGVLDKLAEETGEFRRALASRDPVAMEDEIGDLLFSVVNLARLCRIEPEGALRGTIRKFVRRFQHMEGQAAAARVTLDELTLKELDNLWEQAKRALGPLDGYPHQNGGEEVEQSGPDRQRRPENGHDQEGR